MKKIRAFAGSNSTTSINHQLLNYVKNELSTNQISFDLLRLINYNIPIYSEDTEKEIGIPNGIKELYKKIQESDGLVLSVAEHNSNLVAYFKSVLDWLSRLDRDFVKEKKLLILSTSPGGRGASSSLDITVNMLSRFKAEVIGSLSVPRFYDVLKEDKIVDEDLNKKLKHIYLKFEEAI